MNDNTNKKCVWYLQNDENMYIFCMLYIVINILIIVTVKYLEHFQYI